MTDPVPPTWELLQESKWIDLLPFTWDEVQTGEYAVVPEEPPEDPEDPEDPPPELGQLVTTWEQLQLSKWEHLAQYTWDEVQSGAYEVLPPGEEDPLPPELSKTTWQKLSLSRWSHLANYTWEQIQNGQYSQGPGGPVTDPGTGSDFETVAGIRCRIRTKNFDIGVPHKFKKLFWWGADVISSRQYSIVGRANPITTSFDVPWYSITTYTWEQLEEKTWDNLLGESPSVETIVDTNLDIERKFAKFLKTLRFRQINFEIQLHTSGSLSDGPCRVLSITAIILSKQKVTQKVN